MRLEKGFLHWKADILTEFDPFETGLHRFVDMGKPDFVGKSALQTRQEKGLQKQLVTLEVDCSHAPARPGASVMEGTKVIGTITSGDWGHRTNKNLAYAFMRPDQAENGAMVKIDILGDLIDAQVIQAGPFDPSYERIKA